MSYGDRRCLIWGLVAEETVRALRGDWQSELPIEERISLAGKELLRRGEKAWEQNAEVSVQIEHQAERGAA